MDFKTVGLVSLAYSGTASLSQPLFGWLADRYGTRWIGLALVWTAALFAMVGFAPSFPALRATSDDATTIRSARRSCEQRPFC